MSNLREQKGRRITAVLLTVFALAALIVAVRNDAGLYQTTIARVMRAETAYDRSETGPGGQTEMHYAQTLALRILNGPDAGRTATAQNAYAQSLVASEKYAAGDDLFVGLSEESGVLTAVVTGEKRDVIVALLAGLFVAGMIWVARWRGILTVASFLFNLGVFCVCMKFYMDGVPLSRLRMVMICAFLISTLLLAGGLTKKALGAILASLITLILTALLYRAAVALAGEPPYELMDYIFVPEDLEDIFLAGVLIGCLGAVMDVAITICSAVSELVRTAGPLSYREIAEAVREIGNDIMGTMVGVLLFSYLSGSLPIILVKVMNGYSFGSMVRFHALFELIRFLAGSIGIVLAIPVSGVIAAALLARRRA